MVFWGEWAEVVLGFELKTWCLSHSHSPGKKFIFLKNIAKSGSMINGDYSYRFRNFSLNLNFF
jgi:hypothetical protein